jgi:hypothetical protein
MVAIWYLKLLFANKWLLLIRIDAENPDAKKGAAAIMLCSFLLMFVNCLAITILR